MVDIDFGALIEPVARELWGDPNPRHSKANELRWGKNGSKSVSLEKGTWHDHEAKVGGGTLDLVESELGLHGADRLEWLREKGFIAADDRRNGNGAGHHHEPRAPAAKPKIVTTYDYSDESGALLFQVCRMVPKTFRQRQPKGDGWEWNIKGVRLVPYRLRDLQAAIAEGADVFVVEGEKDVERLAAEGVTATCNPMGAGKWPKDFGKLFENANRVIIIPDNDDAGRRHAMDVGASLRGIVPDVRLLDLPDLEDKEDVSDFYDRGGTTEELFDLVKTRSRSWSQELPASTFGAIRFEDLDQPGEELSYVIDGWFTLGDLSVTAGPSKSGKSFLLVHAGMVVALAASDARSIVPDFFGHDVMTPGIVIYFAGEGGRGIKNRLRAYRKHFGIPPKAKVPFVLLTKRLDLLRKAPDGRLSDTDRLIAECKAWQAFYDLPLAMVIVDTLATASAGADENSAKDMTTVFDHCAKIKLETGAHVSLVHHMNAASTKIRGHTSIYANADQVVLVKKEDEGTQAGIRTATLDKQKDDVDGRTLHFELKIIELGVAKNGRPITSCVVTDKPIEGGGAGNGTTPRNAFRPSDHERAFMAALFEALRSSDSRIPHSQETPGVPLSVDLCVHWQDVRSRFINKIWIDGDEKKTAGTIRTRLSRAGTTLLKFNVIGKAGEFVWHTGRPVLGFPASFKRHDEDRETLPIAALSEPEIEDFE
jgi:AAA domain